jgi:hypothetical protein
MTVCPCVEKTCPAISDSGDLAFACNAKHRFAGRLIDRYGRQLSRKDDHRDVQMCDRDRAPVHAKAGEPCRRDQHVERRAHGFSGAGWGVDLVARVLARCRSDVVIGLAKPLGEFDDP